MKNIILSIAAVFVIAFSTQARVLTVSNIPGSFAMFTTIQPAIDIAKVGDTVFVHASANNYAGGGEGGQVQIRKRIVLMGEGGRPNYSRLSSNLVGYAIQIDSIPGVPISGLIITGIRCQILDVNAKGIIIKNCYFEYGTFSGTGHTIVNNIINQPIGLGTNCILSNNIVGGVNAGSNCVLANNIFVNGSVSGINVCTVVNNIFLSSNNAYGSGVNNSFSKNIQKGTDLPVGNFTNTQPASVFVEVAVISTMTEVPKLTASWKHLTTSVGKNAGTDGKDIGVYGGNFPWPSNKIFNGDPGLPKVEMLEVQNSVVEPNSTIKINFKAKSASAK